MNPVFVFLVILGAVFLWFASSSIFFPLGDFIFEIWDEASREIKRKDDEESEDE